MKKVERSALLPYAAADMFDLVNDIQSYPEFLPWCSQAEVLEQNEQQVIARLEFAKGGLKHSFTTRNQLNRPHRMQVDLVDGPFKHLVGYWEFWELEAHACKIVMELDFEFSTPMLDILVSPFFSLAIESMVSAFSERAQVVHGKKL
jgi:ribosome-associated toxin RatA of RatAB toxin-antitoxin module